MIVINELGTVFANVTGLGISHAKPELKYGKVARQLREGANLTVEQLSSLISIKAKQIEEIEEQKKGMTEDVMARYCKQFDVQKEDFFDINTARLIAGGFTGGNPTVFKEYETAEECQKEFDMILEAYLKDNNIVVDFRKNPLF